MMRFLLPLAVLMTVSACGDSPPSATANDQVTAAPAQAPTPLGETGKAKTLDFSVTKVETANHVGIAGVGPKAEAGETFVVVSYTLKNTGTAPLGFLERPAISLQDGSGATFSPDESASLMAAGMMDDASGMSNDLNPNVSAKSKATWKVDKGAFDKATWRVVVASDPELVFALK